MMRRETQLKLRASKGRRLLPDFRRRLEAACGSRLEPFVPLSLEGTERLRARFFGMVKESTAAQRLTWGADRSDEIWPALKALAKHIGGQEVVLFHALDEFVGAVVVAADIVLPHARGVWKVVGQDFAICTVHLEDGLCLEFNHYAGADEYELTAWGTLVCPYP